MVEIELPLPEGTRLLPGVPEPWQAYLVPVSEFPLPESERPALRAWTLLLQERLSALRLPTSELLLQLWKLSPSSGTDVLADNVEEWNPDFGLGVWPNRKPPQGWTEATMMDAAAAVMRGDEPEMPAHRLLRLVLPLQRHPDAIGKICGYGTLITIFATESFDGIEESGRAQYLPTIVDRSYRDEDFYFPLIDCAAISSARSAQELDAVMCGIDFYARESPEDRGMLILSRIRLRISEPSRS